MITKQESYTKKPVLVASSPRSAIATNEPSPPRTPRLLWDMALCLGASAYVGLVLFDDLEGPLLSVALIFLLAFELVHPHLSNH